VFRRLAEPVYFSPPRTASGDLELGNVGLIECAPNALVCQNIFVPESFGEGPQMDGCGSRWGPDPLSWVTFYELRASLTPSRSVLVFAFVRELARGLSGYFQASKSLLTLRHTPVRWKRSYFQRKQSLCGRETMPDRVCRRRAKNAGTARHHWRAESRYQSWLAAKP
jgi:hypothetical protein